MKIKPKLRSILYKIEKLKPTSSLKEGKTQMKTITLFYEDVFNR